MTCKIEIQARKLWEEEKYNQAVEVGIEQLTITDVRSEREFTSLFLNLAYSLYAASEVKLYNEFRRIFEHYIKLINRAIDIEPPIGYHNHACLMQHNLMAVLFHYYNAERNPQDIQDAINLLEFWMAKVADKDKFSSYNSKLLKLSNLIFASKNPYYVVDFRLPLSLPLPDGKYPINTISGVKSIEIENRAYKDITSAIGDRYFSVVKITAEGFTSTDNYWNGPSLDNADGAFNLNICIKSLNEIVLHTKLIREDFRLKTISHQDIGRSTTTQFNGEGEDFHSTISFGFGGDALVDVLSRQELDHNEIKELTERLESSKIELHEELFSAALIEQSNENLTGAFYLLNSSCESLIQKYVHIAAKEYNRIPEYELFMEGKSFCNDCDLYKRTSGGLEPPIKSMPPSLFSQLKFFKQIGLSTNKEFREMRRFLLKVRNDDLRNSLIHGRANHVPRNAVKEGIESFRSLKTMLTKLIDKGA